MAESESYCIHGQQQFSVPSSSSNSSIWSRFLSESCSFLEKEIPVNWTISNTVTMNGSCHVDGCFHGNKAHECSYYSVVPKKLSVHVSSSMITLTSYERCPNHVWWALWSEVGSPCWGNPGRSPEVSWRTSRSLLKNEERVIQAEETKRNKKMVGKTDLDVRCHCPAENLYLEGSEGQWRTLVTFIFLASMF